MSHAAPQHNDRTGERPEPPKPMRIEAWLFSAGIGFFLPLAIIYHFLTKGEPVGVVGFGLLSGMFALVGGYLWITARRIDPRPEDDPLAEIEDRAGEVGVFAPHSWWPLVLGLAVTLAFAGVAIGWWMVGLGFAVAIVGLVGQLFEFSRGQHRH